MVKSKKNRSAHSANNKPTLAVTIRRLEAAVAELQTRITRLTTTTKAPESELLSRIETLEAKINRLADPR